MPDNWKRFPHTFHLPWSGTVSKEDKRLDNVDHFIGKEVIVTEKLDGESTTIYTNGLHARSPNYTYHSSRAWVKALQAMIGPQITDDMRICGENMYAKHSIYYDRLSTYFYTFAIFEKGICLAWNDMIELCEYFQYSLKTSNKFLGEQYQTFHLQTAPVLYRGIWDEEAVMGCYTGKSAYGNEQEGYVVRLASEFSENEYDVNVAKFVKEGFIAGDAEHWSKGQVVPNKLLRNLSILNTQEIETFNDSKN